MRNAHLGKIDNIFVKFPLGKIPCKKNPLYFLSRVSILAYKPVYSWQLQEYEQVYIPANPTPIFQEKTRPL